MGGTDPEVVAAMLRFTAAFHHSGQPCLTLPGGFDEANAERFPAGRADFSEEACFAPAPPSSRRRLAPEEAAAAGQLGSKIGLNHSKKRPRAAP
jgi:hypothetical protein